MQHRASPASGEEHRAWLERETRRHAQAGEREDRRGARQRPAVVEPARDDAGGVVLTEVGVERAQADGEAGEAEVGHDDAVDGEPEVEGRDVEHARGQDGQPDGEGGGGADAEPELQG